MPISTLRGYPRIGGVIGYGPVGGSGIWKLQERYALADDFYDDVSLLLKMNGANGSTTFLDSSKHGHAVTANGGAAISTTQSKFGGSSLALDGTGDSITQAANSSHGYGTGDFTIEFWLFLNTSSVSTIFSHLTSASSTHPHLYIDTTIRFFTASADRITGDSLNTGQWYHIALCRSSGSTRLFIDGTQSGSTYSDTNNYGSTAPLGVGTYWNSGSPVATNTLNGYIDSLRITKGQARYTAAFTPPQRDFLP
jgi:hypothetical protein